MPEHGRFSPSESCGAHIGRIPGMSRMTTTYETGRVGQVCAATGAPLPPGEIYVGALCEIDEDPGMQRFDYSKAAWDAGTRPPRLMAHWRGVVPARDKPDRPTLDAASLLSLFESLAEAAEPRHVAFRYVLCLLLVRKRVLSVTGTRDASPRGLAVMLVRPRGSAPEDPSIEVIDPAIDEVLLADITEQMRAALGIEP